MWRIPLGADDRELLLAPSWSGWPAAAQGAALALSLFVPLALILLLYRWELRLVTRRAGAALLTLRLAGLLVIWTMAALQPTIAHVHVEEAPSRVLVAVDLSGSMATADPQRSWAEKLQLAQALQLHDDNGIDPTQLASDLEALGPNRPPTEAMVKLTRGVDGLTRREIARRLVATPSTGLFARLGKHHQVEVVGFHDALVDAAEPGVLFDVEPGAGTNLALPLQRAVQQQSDSAGKLLGVVVLSDGRHNGRAIPLTVAKQVKERDAAVFPVALGSRTPPADIAILDVQAPTQVFKDAEATVTARMRVHGLPALAITLTLEGPDGFAKQEKVIQHDGADRVYEVEFQVKLTNVGTQRLEVHARRAESGRAEGRNTPDSARQENATETTTDNNRLATVVRVASEKSRVLIVDDEARWEHHYLSTALARDPDLKVDRVLFSPPRVGTMPENKLEGLGHAKRSLPALQGADGAKEDPLWEYDVIVLGDVPSERLPREQAERLEKFVADRGGTLIVVAGKRHVPLAYQGPSHPLVKLLPIESPAALVSPDGFAVLPTELGEKTPFFQLEATLEASRQRWRDLPAHYWGVTGKLKPGAAMLARADIRRAPATAAATPQDNEKDGVIVQQHYGFGKVVFLGLESTWRWRYRVGDHYHHRFWGQLMRWAVSDPFLPDGNRFVRFGSKAPTYRHDQEVELLARLGEESPLPVKAAIRVIRQRDGKSDETTAVVPLAPQAQRPRMLEGKLKQLPAGNYRLELDIPDLKDKLAGLTDTSVHGFTVMPPESGEQIDLATNWDLLQSLAATTGGRLFTAADADQLPDLLAAQVHRKEIRSEDRPWQDLPIAGWILGVLILLLTLEWSLRKVAGLP